MERYGDAIEGSRYFRGFCTDCGTPLRIAANQRDIGIAIACEKCRGPLTNSKATRDDSDPWQENAVRAMEDQE